MIIARQFVRAAFSVGANLHEAIAGESRADFTHKYLIALKEAHEANYWLVLLRDSGVVPKQRIQPLIQETEEICKIIGAITSRMRRTTRPPSPSLEK